MNRISRFFRKLFHKECHVGTWEYSQETLSFPKIPAMPGIRGDMTAYKLNRFAGDIVVYSKKCSACGRKVTITAEEYQNGK